MSHETKIEWTDRATNPIRYRDAAGRDVWACVKVSAGCKNCYAEATALRFEKGQAFSPQNMAKLTPYLRDKEVKELLSPKKTPAGSKVFVGDMTDVFGEWVTPDLIDGLFGVFARRPDVVFQVLTKRPERMARHLCGMGSDWEGRIRGTSQGLPIPFEQDVPWPLPNVWLGTSVEDQAAADERIPHLLRVPAAVRFLSMEPLLGPVRIDELLVPHGDAQAVICPLTGEWAPREPSPVGDGVIHWVIVGGESGHGARPMHPMWARSLRDQCQAAGVPFFFKQHGEWSPADEAGWFAASGDESKVRAIGERGQAALMHKLGKKAAGRLLDGREWSEFPAITQ